MRVDESGLEWIWITHPTTGGEAEVTRTSFDDLWESKGWVIRDEIDKRPPAQRTPAAPAPGAAPAEADNKGK